MSQGELATRLAQSLTLGAWSKDAVQRQLHRRLPVAMRKLAEGMAGDLLAALPTSYAPSAAKVARELRYTGGFGQLYAYCKKRNIWPGADLASPVMAPIAAFTELDLPQLSTPQDLAEWLWVSLDRLEYLADRHARFEQHGETAINHYHYVTVQKLHRGVRLIEAPKEKLKALQRKILRGILEKVPTHGSAFGFVKGRNLLQAARRHAGEQAVVCFDLKDFFPSIGAGRVFGLFRCLGYPHAVARLLTALCTTTTPPRVIERFGLEAREDLRRPHLPQGAPSSPALANHAVFALDCRLSSLAQRRDAHYSRYADDITFSGDQTIIAPLLGMVPEIVQDEGLRLNDAKTRVLQSTERQVVTGVVVNQHLNVPREAFDMLKAVLHACARPEDRRLADPAFRASVQGQIAWVSTVNPRRGTKLSHMFSVALAEG
jgi:hypothetical protein